MAYRLLTDAKMHAFSQTEVAQVTYTNEQFNIGKNTNRSSYSVCELHAERAAYVAFCRPTNKRGCNIIGNRDMLLSRRLHVHHVYSLIMPSMRSLHSFAASLAEALRSIYANYLRRKAARYNLRDCSSCSRH
jgi:hypothetical protein